MIKKLLEYDNLYYNLGSPKLSDVDYDILKEKAKKENPNHPYFRSIGSPILGNKVKLPFVLGSLNKVKSNNVNKWLDKYDEDIIASTKLDGVSIYSTYYNGVVINSSTRGNGEFGKDITEKAKIFSSNIKYKGILYVRGECMIIDNKYKELGFKNARNGCAGILNKKNTKNSEYITPFFYEILYIENDKLKNEFDKMYFLKKIFENVPEFCIINGNNKQSLIKNFLLKSKRKNYDVDGIVLTPINYKRENVLYPKNKVAYKENDKGVETMVKKIEWNISRTSKINPVILINPIEIQGSKINRVTGFNAKFIIDNNIGKGTKLLIERSGDVIPFVSKVLKETKFEIPLNCPSCNNKLQIKGVDLICNNINCLDMIHSKIEHFLITLGAENITSKTLKKLNVKSIKDCYDLDEFGISIIDGFGVKRGQQIVNEIQKTLNNTPDKVICSFGILGVGKTVSKSIYNTFRSNYNNDVEFMNDIFNLKKSQLEKINGIGKIISSVFVSNINKYKELYNFLISKGLKFKSNKKLLNNIIITLTGSDNAFNLKRNIIVNIIEKNGGIVKGISKKTNYLVTSDINSKSSKTKKAKKYDIKIISYEELKNMIG